VERTNLILETICLLLSPSTLPIPLQRFQTRRTLFKVIPPPNLGFSICVNLLSHVIVLVFFVLVDPDCLFPLLFLRFTTFLSSAEPPLAQRCRSFTFSPNSLISFLVSTLGCRRKYCFSPFFLDILFSSWGSLIY